MTIWENSSQKLGTGQIVKISLAKNLLAIVKYELTAYKQFLQLICLCKPLIK